MRYLKKKLGMTLGVVETFDLSSSIDQLSEPPGRSLR